MPPIKFHLFPNRNSKPSHFLLGITQKSDVHFPTVSIKSSKKPPLCRICAETGAENVQMKNAHIPNFQINFTSTFYLKNMKREEKDISTEKMIKDFIEKKRKSRNALRKLLNEMLDANEKPVSKNENDTQKIKIIY